MGGATRTKRQSLAILRKRLGHAVACNLLQRNGIHSLDKLLAGTLHKAEDRIGKHPKENGRTQGNNDSRSKEIETGSTGTSSFASRMYMTTMSLR